MPVRVLFTRYPAERAGPSPASRAAPSSERNSPLPATDTYPQHVVTAVIVAHDGHAWLPQLADSLLEQTRPVQRVVAVDTGSRDRSGSVLVGKLGQGVVFGMERGTGFGAAVARAVAHRAARTRIPLPSGLPSDDRVEWLWLLHDDCEPAADALEQLLRGAVETRQAAVIGPKLMDWSDRRVILEAGVTIDTAGRRITGIEPREVDQGQHDGDRDVLAVSSAGMLVRRDVWEHLGGFDPAMPLFRDDVDFCWRVHAAGYRVRLVTDAVVYHVEASARRRRPISVTRRPQQADRRHALVTLLGNLPQPHMLAAAADATLVSVLRSAFFLVAKRPAAALDEMAAIGSVLGHPMRLLRIRRRRAPGRRPAYGRLRPLLPPGRSLRRIAEFAAAALSRSAQLDTAGSHHATDDPTDDDSMLVDSGLMQRILTSPAVLLLAGLTVVALVAERRLLGGGPLGGGALIPPWGGASGLWRQYLQSFHPTGVGSGSSAPPYLAVIAMLATILGGKPWLAIDVILLGCVPLAGMTAYAALRRVTRSVPVRAWAAASYALLPVAMGTVASGRVGTAAAFILMPLIAVAMGRMLVLPGRHSRRSAWAAGLAVTVVAAFVPLIWLVAVIAAATVAVARPGKWQSALIVALVPPVLLMPWTLQAVTSPGTLLLEAGLQQPGLASAGLPARSLMLLSPGGPGLPPFWVTIGLIAAALAGLVADRRPGLALAGWGTALLGLGLAVGVSRVRVTPAGGGPAVPGWPGTLLVVTAAGLVLAAIPAGEALPGLIRRRGVMRPAGVAGGVTLTVIACSAPLLSAAFWLISGVRGPVAQSPQPVVPSVVSASGQAGLQLRTLVLRSADGRVSYALMRGTNPSLGDPALTPVPSAQRALATAVSTLVAPSGGEAGDQGRELAGLGIGFVLMPAPVDAGLARILDGVAGLRPVSSTSAFDLWRLVEPAARVRVLEPDGTTVALASGPVAVTGARAPATGGILELAEPVGGWTATLDGRPLTAVASPAGSWAQAFRLPSGGGRLDITRQGSARGPVLAVEALLLIVVAVLALPGTRPAAAEEASAAGQQESRRRRSRRGGPEAADDRAEEQAEGQAEEAPTRVPAARHGRGLPRVGRSRPRPAGSAANAGPADARPRRAAPAADWFGEDPAVQALAGPASGSVQRRGTGAAAEAGHGWAAEREDGADVGLPGGAAGGLPGGPAGGRPSPVGRAWPAPAADRLGRPGRPGRPGQRGPAERPGRTATAGRGWEAARRPDWDATGDWDTPMRAEPTGARPDWASEQGQGWSTGHEQGWPSPARPGQWPDTPAASAASAASPASPASPAPASAAGPGYGDREYSSGHGDPATARRPYRPEGDYPPRGYPPPGYPPPDYRRAPGYPGPGYQDARPGYGDPGPGYGNARRGYDDPWPAGPRGSAGRTRKVAAWRRGRRRDEDTGW